MSISGSSPRWLGLAAAYGGNLVLDTGALCEPGFERERRAIRLWNDTSHLREAQASRR